MHQLLAWRQFPGHNARSWKPNRAWISQRAEQTEVRTQKSGIQEMSWPSPTEEGTAQTESSRNLQETLKMLATYLCMCETKLGLPKWLRGKEPACQCRRCRVHPWVGKIPWSRKWESTPVFLPGRLHGQRSLAGCSPRGCKESGTNEGLSTHARTRAN